MLATERLTLTSGKFYHFNAFEEFYFLQEKEKIVVVRMLPL